MPERPRWHVVLTLEGQVRANDDAEAIETFRSRVERAGLRMFLTFRRATPLKGFHDGPSVMPKRRKPGPAPDVTDPGPER